MTDVILTQKMDTICQNTLRASIFYTRREKKNVYLYGITICVTKTFMFSYLAYLK